MLLSSCRRAAFSLTEILVAVAIASALAVPFLAMKSRSDQSLMTLPNRIFALYFAFDLMEERLSLPFDRVKSIKETRCSEYYWIKKNVEALQAEATGDRRDRIDLSARFLERFAASVDVSSVTPARKQIKVTVHWTEQGIERTHLLEGLVDK